MYFTRVWEEKHCHNVICYITWIESDITLRLLLSAYSTVYYDNRHIYNPWFSVIFKTVDPLYTEVDKGMLLTSSWQPMILLK